jgi:hypothetical protein
MLKHPIPAICHDGHGALFEKDGNVENQATSWNRPDHRVLLVTKRSAKFDQALGDGIVGNHDVWPDGGHQFLSGHQLAGVLEKVLQHREGLWPQCDLFAAPDQAAAPQIQLEIVEEVPPAQRLPGICSGFERCQRQFKFPNFSGL